MKNRLLGAALIVSTVILMLNGFRTAGTIETDGLTHAVYFLWGIGGICGVLGLIRANALGSNAVARTLGFLPLLGFASFVLANGFYLLGFLAGTEPLFNTLIAIAWIGMMVGMLVVGILTIASKAWTGWRRFVPLSTAIMMPVAVAISAAAGNQAALGWLPFAVWILLGTLIAVSPLVPHVEPGVSY